jgi:chorismate-pyruvate lyase
MKLDSTPEDYFYDPIHGFSGQRKVDVASSENVDFGSLPPLLRTLLVSDGTVTKFLEAYYLEPIRVERIFHDEVTLMEDIPALELSLGRKVLQRKVVLRGIFSKQPYDYAESFINTDLLWPWVKEDLLRGRLGIGELLRDRRVETYRELLGYGRRSGGNLSSLLEVAADEDLIYRYYRIFVNRLPTLYITDTFPVSHFQEKEFLNKQSL